MKKHKSKTPSTFLNNFLYFCSIISKICLSVFILTFIYLTLVYWGDSIRNIEQFSVQDQKYYMRSIYNILLFFQYSAFGVIIFTTISNFKYSFYSKVMLIISVIFAYGIPFCFTNWTESSDLSKYPLLGNIIYTYSYVGKIALVIAIILYIKDISLDIANALNKLKISNNNKIKSVKRSGGKIGNHCWDSGYCSKEIREFCPAFEQKKNCWKLKTGCCDETLFLKAGNSKYAKELLKYMDLPKMSDKDLVDRCKKCHIYLVHQRRKYKTLFPIIILISLCMGYGVYLYCWNFFEKLLLTMDKFARFLVPKSGSIVDINGAMTVLVSFLVIVTVILLISLMVQLLHYSIFKLKL